MKLTQLLLVAGLFVSNITTCNKFTSQQTRVVFGAICEAGEYDAEKLEKGQTSCACINKLKAATAQVLFSANPGEQDVVLMDNLRQLAHDAQFERLLEDENSQVCEADISVIAIPGVFPGALPKGTAYINGVVFVSKIKELKAALAELNKPAEPTTLWEAATRDDEPKAQTGSDELK